MLSLVCKKNSNMVKLILSFESLLIQHALEMHIAYRANMEKKAGVSPKRIIVYRGECKFCARPLRSTELMWNLVDGISESRFKEVMVRGGQVLARRRRHTSVLI